MFPHCVVFSNNVQRSFVGLLVSADIYVHTVESQSGLSANLVWFYC